MHFGSVINCLKPPRENNCTLYQRCLNRPTCDEQAEAPLATASLVVGIRRHWSNGLSHVAIDLFASDWSYLRQIISYDVRRQAITWTNADLFSTETFGKCFSEIVIKIQIFSFNGCAFENLVCQNGGHIVYVKPPPPPSQPPSHPTHSWSLFDLRHDVSS